MVRLMSLTLLVVVAYSSFAVLSAAPYEDIDTQDWKLMPKTGNPDSSIVNRFPAYMAGNERLLLQVPPGSIGGRGYRVHKKFDSLSGGTFGMQKRFPYSPDSNMVFATMT